MLTTPGAFAEQAAQGGEDERRRLAERRAQDGGRLRLGVAVVEDEGDDEHGDDHRGDEDRPAGAWRHGGPACVHSERAAVTYDPHPDVNCTAPVTLSSSPRARRTLSSQRTTTGAQTSSRMMARMTSMISGRHLGLERHLRLPGAHHTEQQRRRDGQDRVDAGQQGDGDAVEAEADVATRLVAVEDAGRLDGPAEAGQEPAEAHGQDGDAGGRDAAVRWPRSCSGRPS